MKILIAEDDSVTRKLLEASLSKWGYEVIAVPDGSRALELLENDHSLHCAILDWMMPGKEGIYICNRMREERSNRIIYIILMTPQEGSAEAVSGLASGADDYITKPLDKTELHRKVLAAERIIHLEMTVSRKTEELQELQKQLDILREIVPNCTRCGKPRQDDRFYRDVEIYLNKCAESPTPHGLCPDCRNTLSETGEIDLLEIRAKSPTS